MEILSGKSMRGELSAHRLDHRWRAGCIDLMPGKVWLVRQHRIMHPPAPHAIACGQLRARARGGGASDVRQHGDISQSRIALRPFFEQRVLVKLLHVAGTPVELHLSRHVPFEHVPCNRFDRRESGSTRDENQRPRIIAIGELAERAFDAQERSGSELSEQPARKPAARRKPHVELQLLAVMWRAGNRKAPPPSLFQQNVHILSRDESQRLDSRQPQRHLHHIHREALERVDPARQRLDLHFSNACDHARFDRQVRNRARLAEKHIACARIVFGQPERTHAMEIHNIAVQ